MEIHSESSLSPLKKTLIAFSSSNCWLRNGFTVLKEEAIKPCIQYRLTRLHYVSLLQNLHLLQLLYDFEPINRHFRVHGVRRFIPPFHLIYKNNRPRKMAASWISLSELKPGRDTQTVVTRLLRFLGAKECEEGWWTCGHRHVVLRWSGICVIKCFFISCSAILGHRLLFMIYGSSLLAVISHPSLCICPSFEHVQRRS